MKPTTKILLKCQKVTSSCTSHAQVPMVRQYLSNAERFLNLNTSDMIHEFSNEEHWVMYRIRTTFEHRWYS